MSSTSPFVADRIKARLMAAFSPVSMELIDESASHAGHAGYKPGGESHFRLTIAAAAFDGKSRLERQRMVNQALEEELADIHALRLTVRGAEE
ncbi:MAG: BolA family protein [Alphaproteobacteria bacterium]